VCICLGSGGFAAGQVVIDVNPALPPDIAGGTTKTTLQQAAAFAWQEFIALNWPAMAGQRDVPDTSQKFGSNAGGVFGAQPRNPLVWETYRGKVEIFNTENNTITKNYVPPGYDGKLRDLGYNTPPAYFYGTLAGRPVQACPGQAAPASPAWINLDETTEIGLAQMFAGGPAIQDSANSSPQLIRYAVKANRVEYEYIAAPNNQYFLPSKVNGPSGNDGPAGNNKVAYSQSPPVAPTPPFISFPTGTIEIKSAWRPLNSYDQPARFHVQTVRFYEKKGGPNHNLPCYFEQQWGLIALHIIQKTPTAPAFIYATFEQADNIRQPNATPVEDPNGNVVQPISGAAPTTPELAYQDSSTAPKVSTRGAFCTPQNNLYFKDNPMDAGLTGGGAICVNQRYEPIPPDVIAVNNAAHQAITSYNTANGVVNSPWLFYKLVSVQASPFDVSAKSPTDPFHGPAVFYQANIVVETNYTLQQFLGRISSSSTGSGAPTSLGGLPPPNVLTPAPTPPSVVGVNMGGCMGCHGNAQVIKGTDFSFILAEGPTYSPDTPSAIGDAQLRAKYLGLFQH
jgi:hypothetical protein